MSESESESESVPVLKFKCRSAEDAADAFNFEFQDAWLPTRIEPADLRRVILMAAYIVPPGEYARLLFERSRPGDPPGPSVRPFYYFVRMKRPSVFLLAVIVDLIGHSRIACAATDLNGFASEVWSRLSPAEGEYCIFYQTVQLTRDELPITMRNVSARIGGVSCKFPDHGCRYKKEGRCGATSDEVDAVLRGLKEKGALVRSGRRLKTAI